MDKARRFSGLSAYKRLLDSGVEAVTVVNIPRFHAQHARAAIEAGCHVYAAKPVAIAPAIMGVACMIFSLASAADSSGNCGKPSCAKGTAER